MPSKTIDKLHAEMLQASRDASAVYRQYLEDRASHDDLVAAERDLDTAALAWALATKAPRGADLVRALANFTPFDDPEGRELILNLQAQQGAVPPSPLEDRHPQREALRDDPRPGSGYVGEGGCEEDVRGRHERNARILRRAALVE